MAGRSRRSIDQAKDGTYRAITREIRELADQLRDAFVAQRQSYVPGSAGVGRGADIHFVDAAFRCRAEGVTAGEYVRARIDVVLRRGGNLYPQILVSDAVAARTEEARLISREMDANRYVNQGELLVLRACALGGDYAAILRNEAVDFTPLFRCCIAMQLGLADIVARHREEALAEAAGSEVGRRFFAEELARL